jgi:hypothetical protein
MAHFERLEIKCIGDTLVLRTKPDPIVPKNITIVDYIPENTPLYVQEFVNTLTHKGGVQYVYIQNGIIIIGVEKEIDSEIMAHVLLPDILIHCKYLLPDGESIENMPVKIDSGLRTRQANAQHLGSFGFVKRAFARFLRSPKK